MKTNGNDAAYPDSMGPNGITDGFVEDGCTKRELFAAMTMQGLLSNPEAIIAAEKHAKIPLEKLAVTYADGLIAALNTEGIDTD